MNDDLSKARLAREIFLVDRWARGIRATRRPLPRSIDILLTQLQRYCRQCLRQLKKHRGPMTDFRRQRDKAEMMALEIRILISRLNR